MPLEMAKQCLQSFDSRHQPGKSKIIMSTLLINSLFLLLPLAVNEVSCACGGKEYVVGQECCPMCRSGYYVRAHCTDIYTTRCAPCSYLTFTDKHNGQEACSPCSVCDSSAGVRVKRNCSSTSDTLCEPLEGHYCTDPIKDGCQGAVQHTKCLPGQYIKLPGSASSDTVCQDCTNNTFSDGTFESCRPHIRCSSLGLSTRTAGTNTADAECGERRHHVVLWVQLTCIISAAAVLILRGYLHKNTGAVSHSMHLRQCTDGQCTVHTVH